MKSPTSLRRCLRATLLLATVLLPSSGITGGYFLFAQDIIDSPTISISPTKVTVGESDGSVTFTVKLSDIPNKTTTVQYASSDGTATAPGDYTSTSGTLTFAAKTTTLSQTVTVPIINDSTQESTEDFTVTLSNPVNGTLHSTDYKSTVNILDDDGPPPTVKFSSGSYSVTEGGGTATITVNLSQAWGSVVTVGYATFDGSATAGSDYTATSGTLTFNVGETSQTFTIPILNDDLPEQNETVNVGLGLPSNATLGNQSTAVLTILDDDITTLPGPATVEFEFSSWTVNESDLIATITVRMTGTPTGPVSVSYSTSDGTATADPLDPLNGDYMPAQGVLTWLPSEAGTTKSFTIIINDDLLAEWTETVNLTLSAPVNAVLGARSSAVLYILDDDVVCP